VTGDRALTGWAAACADHALAGFARPIAEDPAGRAVAAARAWANGDGAAEAARNAAFDAHRSARDVDDAGHRALATAIRASAAAAASVDDHRLAGDAAGLALEAVQLSSAACELSSRVGAERQWQWGQLDEGRRTEVLGEVPPAPPSASCALDAVQH